MQIILSFNLVTQSNYANNKKSVPSDTLGSIEPVKWSNVQNTAWSYAQQTHDPIMSLCQNDVATSFWHHNDIIVSRDRWVADLVHISPRQGNGWADVNLGVLEFVFIFEQF